MSRRYLVCVGIAIILLAALLFFNTMRHSEALTVSVTTTVEPEVTPSAVPTLIPAPSASLEKEAESAQVSVYQYDSDSLRVSVLYTHVLSSETYLTSIWMQDPGKQIRKATSTFHENLGTAPELAALLPEAKVIINGSGYVSPIYPEIPDNYPGTSADYYYTALGSVTVTDGTVLWCLSGVPYYGLTLQADGLHLHVGDDPDAVLAAAPSQTWSFYELCPMIQDGKIILDTSWAFARRKAIRTIISLLPDGTYLLLSTESMTLVDAAQYLQDTYHPVWTYDLDGGPSSALFVHSDAANAPHLVFGARQPIVDVMGFYDLEDLPPAP